jgi:ABC-type uncharacterized transport system substrate-binding protein
MRRREFIRLAGSAAIWPAVARAQQKPVRRIGFVANNSDTESRGVEFRESFERGLVELGWKIGQDLVIDYRYGAVDTEVLDRHARELVATRPDVIVGVTARVAFRLVKETRTIPLVFVDGPEQTIKVLAPDFSHPGGNLTGFINFVDSMPAKWLQLLSEIAPQIGRTAIVFHPDAYVVGDIDAAARTLNIQLTRAPVRDSAEIDAAFAALSGDRPGGGIVVPGAFIGLHRQEVIAAANRYKVPVMYPFAFFVREGGLIGYGVDEKGLFRGAAAYVDRILKGAGPGDLPIQIPTKFELVVNAKAAKAIGIEIPQSMLLRADEVIE